MQLRVSAECGHTLPPNVGKAFARLRCCEPPPHDLLHADHAPNAAATTQSAGHEPVLQLRVSARYGHM